MIESEFRERVRDYDHLLGEAHARQLANGHPRTARRSPEFQNTDGILWAVVYDVGHLGVATRIDLGRACGLIIVTGSHTDHVYGWDS